MDVFCFELSMFVNSGATDIVLVTLSSTSRWAMARGHRLNTSIVLAAVHGLSGLYRTVSPVEPSLSRPLPTLSPSLIGHLASVDVKQFESKVRVNCLPPYEQKDAGAALLLSWGLRVGRSPAALKKKKKSTASSRQGTPATTSKTAS